MYVLSGLLLCLFSVYGYVEKTGFNLVPVVPFPQRISLSSTVRRGVYVEEFHVTCTSNPALLQDRVIHFNAARYQRYFSRFQSKSRREGGITQLDIKVEDASADLHIGVNESYTLVIPSSGPRVQISANTRYGAIRGMETFYQLYNVTDGTLPPVHVEDWPRFSYRGLLIDTSRHFLSLEMIFKAIEAMSMNKLNVLHWHIVDDPSFPYYSFTFPQMTEAGAYDLHHIYTAADVQSVIGFAEVHGIVVLPEFDTPGHTLSWGKGIPGLLTHCPGKGSYGGDYGPINPIHDSVYTFLTKLFSEIIDVFPSQYIHLGGDEVPFNCWQANADITSWMKQHKIKDYSALENYYENKLLDIIAGFNQSYVVWEEIFNNGLEIRPETIIHVWKGGWQTTLAKVVEKGYRAIISSPWYLNYITFSRDWKKYYEVEPLNITGTAAQKALVLGGEACMWGEYVDNSNLLSRTFPRSSAVAERLWSSEKLRNEADMEFRLDKHRCGMCARDIPAETVILRSYCPYEFTGWDRH